MPRSERSSEARNVSMRTFGDLTKSAPWENPVHCQVSVANAQLAAFLGRLPTATAFASQQRHCFIEADVGNVAAIRGRYEDKVAALAVAFDSSN